MGIFFLRRALEAVGSQPLSLHGKPKLMIVMAMLRAVLTFLARRTKRLTSFDDQDTIRIRTPFGMRTTGQLTARAET